MFYSVIALLLVAMSTTLQAAPKLRLSTTAVGPVSISQGGTVNPQTVEAFNAGDGDLSLQAASSVSWLTVAVGGSRGCSQQAGSCLPVNINFQTTSLARGAYTGIVTVSDPNALDAPQTITVTVQIGGGVPDTVNLYVAPNGSTDELRFATNSVVASSATTQSGGPWLSLAMDGNGSFRFVVPYRVVGRHLDGMPEGTYSGSIAVSNSPIATENKNVPVVLRVTSQPIARATVREILMRIATGTPAQQIPVSLFNGGLGTLTVSGASATTASGGTWLSTEQSENSLQVKADPSGLAAGTYTGTVTVTSNAVNSSLTIPVQLDIVAQTAPLASYNGVVNSGNFDNGLAPGGVAALFGDQLSYQGVASGTTIPLATDINGVRVLVNDVAAPLYFTSYGQVNFQIPYETNAGEAVIQVERQGQRGNRVSAQILPRAPRIIQIGSSGVIINARDASFVGINGKTVRPGDVITIYMVGLGATGPGVVTGAAAPKTEPLGRVTAPQRLVLGGAFSGVIAVDALYAGLTPSLVGLYQVNVQIPTDLPAGDWPIAVEGDGVRSNTVILPVR